MFRERSACSGPGQSQKTGPEGLCPAPRNRGSRVFHTVENFLVPRHYQWIRKAEEEGADSVIPSLSRNLGLVHIAQADAGAERFRLRRVAPALNMTPPVLEPAGMAPAGHSATPANLSRAVLFAAHSTGNSDEPKSIRCFIEFILRSLSCSADSRSATVNEEPAPCFDLPPPHASVCLSYTPETRGHPPCCQVLIMFLSRRPLVPRRARNLRLCLSFGADYTDFLGQIPIRVISAIRGRPPFPLSPQLRKLRKGKGSGKGKGSVP